MMDVTESIQDVGLADEIKNGLSGSLQKAPNFAALTDKIEAKKAAVGGMDPMSVAKMPLGKYVLKAWANNEGRNLTLARRRSSVGEKVDNHSIEPTEDGVKAAWDDFKASAEFGVLCKYLALSDSLQAEAPNLKQFHEARPLGKGAFGAVFLTFKKDTAKALATKKMVKAIAKQNKMIKDVLIEREVLSKMSSRFCVGLHYCYHDDVTLSLVLTLCPGGDLDFLLKSRTDKKKGGFNPLPTGALKFYIASMALGLQAIHDAGYVYRDLKPQNVLLDTEGQVRISDMGLTADVTKGPIKQCSGTRGYWSPETIKKEPYKTEPDWWSLGVTAFVLFSSKIPFHGHDDEEKDAATLKAEINYKHDEPQDLQEFISALCTVDMTKRLGATGGVKDIKAHPYMASVDWVRLEAGEIDAEIKPNPNDINAPSRSEVEAFKKPKDVEWTAEDEKAFDDWNFFNAELWQDEAIFRIKKKGEIKGAGGGGGGGCCTIS